MLNIALISLKKMLKDIKAIIGIILAPVILSFLFSFLSSTSVSSIEIGIALESDNERNTYIMDQLDKDETVFYEVMSHEALVYKIKNQELITGAVLSEGGISLLKADTNAYNVLKSKLNTIMKQIEMVGDMQIEEHTSVVKYLNMYANSNKSFVRGFIINFMMFSMIYIITEISDLKSSNVLRRVYTSPHEGYQILGGIMLAMFFLLMIQVATVNLMSLILFKELLFVNIFSSMLVIIPFIFAILGLGLLLARVFKNPDLTPIIANIIIIPTGLVSGTFMPIGMLPDFLERFAILSPQYWVARGLDDIGEGIVAAMPSILVLSLLALVLLAVSSYNFTKVVSD